MELTKQAVDARVQAAIENLQAGRGTEDDAGIEFKGDWPEPAAKARQLAGAANALRGERLILVIGVDDNTGHVTVPAKTEPQEWYAKAIKPFDQIAPELLWVQTVFVGEHSESVLALVFSTDEFPYVINANNRREVPLRVATGTESAHRNQLVRMFEPSLRAPAMSITVADARIEWEDSPVIGGGDRRVTLSLVIEARVLVEHVGAQPITLPVREMRARFTCADFKKRLDVHVRQLGENRFPVVIRQGEAPPPEPAPPQHGVYARDQHVIAISPGEFSASMRYTIRERESNAQLINELIELFSVVDQVTLDLAVQVVGVERQVKLDASLERTEAFSPSSNTVPSGERASGLLGKFELLRPDNDPWEEGQSD